MNLLIPINNTLTAISVEKAKRLQFDLQRAIRQHEETERLQRRFNAFAALKSHTPKMEARTP